MGFITKDLFWVTKVGSGAEIDGTILLFLSFYSISTSGIFHCGAREVAALGVIEDGCSLKLDLMIIGAYSTAVASSRPGAFYLST